MRFKFIKERGPLGQQQTKNKITELEIKIKTKNKNKSRKTKSNTAFLASRPRPWYRDHTTDDDTYIYCFTSNGIIPRNLVWIKLPIKIKLPINEHVHLKNTDGYATYRPSSATTWRSSPYQNDSLQSTGKSLRPHLMGFWWRTILLDLEVSRT